MGQKTDFLAHFESLFVYGLLHPMSYTPRFRQMKDLIKIYEMFPFCVFWALTPPSIV